LFLFLSYNHPFILIISQINQCFNKLKITHKNKNTHLKVGKKIITQYAVGGDGEDRTLDLLNAIQALSRHKQKRTLEKYLN